MSWTVTDSELTTSVEVQVMAGPTSKSLQTPTTRFYPARGNTPIFQYAPVRFSTWEIPPFRVTGSAALYDLEVILNSQHRLEITDDMGTVWAVRNMGRTTVTTLDTADRGSFPEWRVTAEFEQVP